MDDYAYTSAIFSCRFAGFNYLTEDRPQGLNIVAIEMDGHGMRPDRLDERLSSWTNSDGRKPKVAYVVPYFPFQGDVDENWTKSKWFDDVP
jgi:hypothetical protein